jgi:formamidopyrimidine-DNA glycosylase
VPELPETETIARDLDAAVSGATIAGVDVPRASVLREVDAAGLAGRAIGAGIVRAWRRAKLVVLDLDTGDRIVVQPRFTGALLVESHPGDGSTLPERERGFVRATFHLADGRALHYRDIRCLGTVALMAPARFDAYVATLGPSRSPRSSPSSGCTRALGASGSPSRRCSWTSAGWWASATSTRTRRSGARRVAPARPARSLSRREAGGCARPVVDVLTESIALRGTSFRDYVDAHGARGGFVDRWRSTGAAERPCPRCARALVGTQAVDGRQTVWCPACQR